MRKSFKKLIAIVLAFAMLASFCLVPMGASAAEDNNLKFGSDGKFKIVIFSDVQDQYPVHQRVLRIMEQAIEREKPDLIVFNGDMTEINTKDVEVDYRRTVEQILGPVVEADVPYAIVFGNHDNQNSTSGTVTDREAMLRVWQSVGDCRTTDPMPSLTGTGTCNIPIYSSNGNDVAFNLWMIDSNSYQNPLDGGSGYDNPHEDQLAWIEEVNKQYPGVNFIAFQHIPVPEIYNLFVEDPNGSKDYGNKKYKLELIDGVEGTAGEFPAPIYAHDNKGEYETFKRMGNVLALVTGHDHLNDFSGKFEEDGIEMTAVPGMTYYNYGKEEIRGYGVIELDEANLSEYNYHSVKFSTLDAEAGGTTATVYDEYDVVNYGDLKENGNALGESYTIDGGHTFTYDATSPSYSAKFRFRWTAGSKPGFQFSFDLGADGNISHPFGVWVKRADQVEPNGAWHLKPNMSDYLVNMSSKIQAGETYDIELGRLKVLSGDPKYVGMYYVYLKVNGAIIQQGYSNTAEDGAYVSGGADCHVSNVIRFGGWGNGKDDVISTYVEPVEQYAPYDVINYSDLRKSDGSALPKEGLQLNKINYSYSYNESAQAAETHSAIFKVRWTMETKDFFQVHFGTWGGSNNFAYILDGANWRDRATEVKVPINPRAQAGDYFDIEVARLYVTSGPNEGKYHSYLKVDGEIIFSKYVSATDENTTKYLKNTLYIGFEDNQTCMISETPYDPNPDAPYYTPDEVTYYDLLVDGNKLSGEEHQMNSKTFTYDNASDNGSVVIKYRWKGDQDANFQLGLDNVDKFAYMFGVQLYKPDDEYPNGRIWLRPGYGPSVGFKDKIVTGQYYDIEFGRLKVKNGEYKGGYYLYFKLDGELLAEDYIDASVVSKAGAYTSKPGDMSCTISNTIYLTFWGGTIGNFIYPSPYVEEYDAYDEVTYNDLLDGGKALPADGVDLGSNKKLTYNATSSSYSAKLKFRWTAGTEAKMVVYYDAWPNHQYGFAVKPPLTDNGGGTVAGENGAWHVDCSNGDNIVQMSKPIEKGETFDIEFGRLKVLNGKNKGLYYVYLMVNGELVKGHYTEEKADPAPTNIIRIVNGTDENIISAIPVEDDEPDEPEVPEENESIYAPYDVVEYEDFLDTGNHHLSADGVEVSTKNYLLHYDVTSETHSVVYKFRWVSGTATYFQMFPGEYVSDNPFMYRINVSDAQWVKRYDPAKETKAIGYAINAGDEFDIEIGRLKVVKGENAGLYHSYFKVNGEEIFSVYVTEEQANAIPKSMLDSIQFATNSEGATYTIKASSKSDVEEPEVPEEPVDPNPDALYYDYDEIVYSDLKDANGNALGNEKVFSGGTTLKYNSTSATGSVLFKYRWTVGSVPKFQMSFEKASDSSMAYRFGAWLDVAKDEYTNGSLWVGPAYGPKVNMPTALVAGGVYDIEFARLKVKNGENAGKYHVYMKIDGALIAEYYVDGAIVDANGNYTSDPDKNVNLNVKSGEIFFAFWGSEGNKISATPIPETYEAYDDLSFDDLWINENSMAGREMDGGHNYTYNATSSSYSMKLKFRWTPGGDTLKFSTFLDEWVYPFCFAAKTPNQSDWGAAAGPNGAWHLVPSNADLIVQMDQPIVAGQAYDIEIGRLKVASGANAGKYYVYFMVNGELIVSYYYDGVVNGVYDNGIALSNKIIFSAPAGNKFKAIPFVEEYEDYDEIGIEDLKDAEGNALGSQFGMQGGTTLTYDKTSATGSVIFKYRWKIGSVAKFQMSFDKTSDTSMGYMFGAWLSAPGEEADYPNGRMWLRPAYGPQVNLAEALVPGTTHNVEFARLKVANGPNAGKYYVYIKIDGVLIAEDYVAANIVDANGNYTTDPSATTVSLSNEIFFAFWGSEGNSILAYREPGSNEHDGTKGELTEDGVINADDLVMLRKIILGMVDTTNIPAGAADFNADGKVDVRDIVAMKKYFAPVNSYERTDALVLGTQEHLLEDPTKTAEYIADASATLGASAYRLSMPIHQLYYATSNNGVALREDNMATFKSMIAALKAKGITQILYVTDSFILPYGYANTMVNHNITVPDPETDPDNYMAWLTVNAAAFKALAAECPEIKFFEPFNEINTTGTRLEKFGIGWNASSEQQAAYKYTVAEKAGIMADLCYYVSEAVKSVDRANQVTTPSIATGSNSVIEKNFMEEFYKAIESGNYPRGKDVADVRVDSYFTIINVHAYVDYVDYTFNYQANNEVDEWAGYINDVYNVAKAHNDGGSRVWLTETGMSTYHPDGKSRNATKVANLITMSLEKLNEDLTFIDTVFVYEIGEKSSDSNASPSEAHFGLFYSGDDMDNAPYAAKESAKAVYSFFNGGTKDYSALDALAARYAE